MRTIAVFDDLKKVALEVMDAPRVALLLASPLRPEYVGPKVRDYSDYLFAGGRKVLEEQIAALRLYAATGAWTVPVDPSHFTPC
jgi:hypothetical protein